MQKLALAGCPVFAGCLTESQLDRVINKLRDGFKKLIDILKQPGKP